MSKFRSYSWNNGFSYSASGHNIESADLNGYINADVVTETTQTLQGVNFSWTSPNLEAVPRWKIKNAGESFQFSGVTTGKLE